MKSKLIVGLAFLSTLIISIGPVAEAQAPKKAKNDKDNPELKALEAAEEQPSIEIVAGASVYHMPLISKINVKEMKLFPHYKPKRAAAGWLHAYIEPTTPTECTMMVEEIPPHSRKLIGRRDTGAYTFIGISGKGYTEARTDVNKPGKGVVWGPKDFFYIPFGSWFGHANPFDEPARILVSVCHLQKQEILNPALGRTRTVPEFTFPGERRKPIPEDDVIENLDWDAIRNGKQTTPPNMDIVKRGPGIAFLGHPGESMNMGRMEWPVMHKVLRGDEGWRGAHAEPGDELGYRGYFSVLQEIPPHSAEIGHKHSASLWFLGVKGKAYMALRSTADSPEARIYWGEWDLWIMPWLSPAGTWHSHADPYDEPARFMTVDIVWGDDGLLNGYQEHVVQIPSDGVSEGSLPDKVFRKKGEASTEMGK